MPKCRECRRTGISESRLVGGICSGCRSDHWWYVVEDPTDSLIPGRRLARGAFKQTLRDGFWPHGSIWRNGRKLYRIEGNNVPLASAMYPQKVVAVR